MKPKDSIKKNIKKIKIIGFLVAASFLGNSFVSAVPNIKDIMEYFYDKYEYDHDKDHSIDVEVVPVITSSLSYERLMRQYKVEPNDIDMAYDIYFINNTVNDVNLSGINIIIGDGYGYTSEVNSENAINIPSGGTYVIRKPINLGRIDYKYKEKMFPTVDSNGYWYLCVDSYLKDLFSSSDGGPDNKCKDSSVSIYYSSDFDNMRHLEKYTVEYEGLGDDNDLYDKIAIEESFSVTSMEYIEER